MRTSLENVLRSHRHPEFTGEAADHTCETGRRHPNNRESAATKIYTRSDNLRISLKSSLPHRVRNDGDQRAAASILFGHEPSPRLRTQAENIEVICRHELAEDPVGPIGNRKNTG